MFFTKILHIATSLFYFNNITTPPPQPSDIGIATDYIPINTQDTFFISYHNNLRKDVRYFNNKFEEVLNN